MDIYHIDAFTQTLFEGNPACVVPLKEWPDDDLLLRIAAENAVAETAFVIARGGDEFSLRWFTPDLEMDLCGHATLATAHALRTITNNGGDRMVFFTRSGRLEVNVQEDMYVLDFPARVPVPAKLPGEIAGALSIAPREVLLARDYILVYDSQEEVRRIRIDRPLFDRINLGTGGVAMTAPGAGCDFVSRFFTPQATILEDFVTGSSHCSLVPYWSGRLGRSRMVARQISSRPGTLYCTDAGDRVLIGGHAVTYSRGVLSVQGAEQ